MKLNTVLFDLLRDCYKTECKLSQEIPFLMSLPFTLHCALWRQGASETIKANKVYLICFRNTTRGFKSLFQEIIF